MAARRGSSGWAWARGCGLTESATGDSLKRQSGRSTLSTCRVLHAWLPFQEIRSSPQSSLRGGCLMGYASYFEDNQNRYYENIRDRDYRSSADRRATDTVQLTPKSPSLGKGTNSPTRNQENLSKTKGRALLPKPARRQATVAPRPVSRQKAPLLGYTLAAPSVQTGSNAEEPSGTHRNPNAKRRPKRHTSVWVNPKLLGSKGKTLGGRKGRVGPPIYWIGKHRPSYPVGEQKNLQLQLDDLADELSDLLSSKR